ncbi:MAG TPA: tetratricopeptide repeat protein [Pirellulales bacterium]|nr:tetratricopeptide repeat protein [Pirellulales bacterium]
MGEACQPLLVSIYRQYLADKDGDAFSRRVVEKYLPASLERVLATGQRAARRAAALALGLLGDYRSNAALGRALGDQDRTVRLLAETALRAVWCRDGRPAVRKRLAGVIHFNGQRQHREALASADELIARAPELAEAWNQRAIAQFGLQQYQGAIRDCQRAVQLNAYHFGALAGMGQCYLRLDDDLSALENFRRALAVNPELDGVRSSISMIERRMKKQSGSEGA